MTDNTIPIPDTCYRVIQDAYVDAGLIGEGQELDSEKITNGIRRLNKIVNYFGTKGIKLFAQTDLALAAPVLVAGKATYSLGDVNSGADLLCPGGRPRRVIEGYYTDQSTTRRPLILVSRNEYNSFSTVTQQGPITSFYPNKQQGFLFVSLWLTPDAQAATGAVHLVTDLQIANLSNLTNTMSFPPEWALALEWKLADQLSTGQPQAVIDRCMGNADRYQSELEDWDVEDASTMFQPDQRTQFVGRRFS